MTDNFKQFRALMQQGKLAEALKIAEKGNDGEKNAFWLTQQAKVLVKQNKFKQAHEAASGALELAPSNNYAVFAAADALYGLKRFEEALGYYRELINDSRLKFSAENKILDTLLRLGRWSEILEFCTACTLPGRKHKWHKIKALRGLKRNEEALEICKQWIREEPGYPPVLREMVDLQVALEGMETVLNNMEKMARIPSLPPIYKELYADLCRRAGKFDKAGTQLEDLGKSSSDPWIQRKRAFLLVKSGREQEGIPLLEELMLASPEDQYLHSSYAAACKRTGARTRALDFYYKLLKANPSARSLMGRIRKLKKTTDADKENGK